MWKVKSVIVAKLDTFILTVKMNLVAHLASVMATLQNVSSVEGSAKSKSPVTSHVVEENGTLKKMMLLLQ